MGRMVEAFDAVDVIRAKRDRHVLSDPQIDWVVDAYTRGVVADEQMSALAMAILLNGMTRAEVVRWTQAMIDSGERLDFSALGATADKHSTGGVGDKITLPLVPLVAACGVRVPQLSGRGLGHTGGTLDKMESIPGWRASLSNDEMLAILRDVGGVICAAGSGLAPADRKLYALRDTTGTVEAIPLIASSIMSKKIAEGTGALVLDVKTGSGAFMREEERARELARTMVDLGNDAGLPTVALLTAMDTPLGLTVGNALEVRESLEVLAGGGPSDVVELTLALGTWGADGPTREAGPTWTRRTRSRTAAPWTSGAAWWRRRAETRTPPSPSPRTPRSSPRTPTGCWSPSTPTRSRWPPGALEPAEPARRTRWTPRRASSCTPSPATASGAGSRYSRCTPPTRPGSRGRTRRSRGLSSSATRRRHRARW